MSFSSTARFFFFPCLPPSLKGALGPRPGGAPRRSASAFAARLAFSRSRASSSLTASFSRASLLRTCSMTSSPTELMWLFTSNESDFRIWTSASLDIPMSLATSYTRRFLAGISPRFLVLVLVLVFLFVLFLFRFRLGFLGQDHALRRGRTQLFGVALLHGGFLGREVLLRLDASGAPHDVHRLGLGRFGQGPLDFVRRIQDRLDRIEGPRLFEPRRLLRPRRFLGELLGASFLQRLGLLDQLLGGLLADSLDREDLFHRRLQEVLHRLDALADQFLAKLGAGPLQLLDVDARAALQILLPVPLALRDQVDFPAGELGREARVLAALPDGQRQLAVRHRDH